MIDRQDLADALARLAPRDRELLELSLRRRVPDRDVATVYGIDVAEVTATRSRAITRLSTELGVEGGKDLGHMLKAMLEPATWEAVPAPAATDAAPAGAQGAPREPVQEELSERADRGSIAAVPGGRRLVTAAAVITALLVPAGVVAALTTVSADDADPDAGRTTRPFEPQRPRAADPFASGAKTDGRFPVAVVRGTTALRERPRGRVKVRIRGKTEWGSPRVLSVVRRKGEWLAVLVPELDNGERGWIREDQATRLRSVAWSLHADLSKRRIAVKRHGKVVKRVRVGVGRRNHATPVGRYAVTDKLRVDTPGSPYGCCALALTGHQPRLPAGWPGGDRLAVHATADRSSLGRAVSLGCMRAAAADARWMMRRIPLGAPVFVRQ